MLFHPSNDSAHIKRETMRAIQEITRKESNALRTRANNIVIERRYDCYGDQEFTEIGDTLDQAISAVKTIMPEDELEITANPAAAFDTHFKVENKPALRVAKELVGEGKHPLVLNFADGLEPGPSPQYRERPQEESLCRATALAKTIEGSLMYRRHRRQCGTDYSNACILSPYVPVFMNDNGELLENIYCVSFISCAAPMTDGNNQQRTVPIVKKRIRRILEVAKAHQYTTLVLGAWGCGRCRNDPVETAWSFYQLLTSEFNGVFECVEFAIADHSDDGRLINPFKDFFCGTRTNHLKWLKDANSSQAEMRRWVNDHRAACQAQDNDKITRLMHRISTPDTCPDGYTFISNRIVTVLKQLLGNINRHLDKNVNEVIRNTVANKIQEVTLDYNTTISRNHRAFDQFVMAQEGNMTIKQVLDNSGFGISETKQIPGREPSYGPIPDGLGKAIRNRLSNSYPNGLYQHQVEAIDHVLAGKDVCLATSTASGKSLVFMAAAADHLQKNPNSLVIGVYPARALTQDQLGKWNDFLNGLDIPVGLIDGSVTTAQRLEILQTKRVIVMTPDVIQSWLMRKLPDTRHRLQSLGMLILDECHLYTEILGTNMAYLLRRIRCVAGANFRMIAATATVGNPGELMKRLTGREAFEIIGSDRDRSPAPEKNVHLVVYGQSEKDREECDKQLIEALSNTYNGKFLVFVDSRQRVERLAGIDCRNRGVMPYRSGYEQGDRNEIQRSLGNGNLKGVISTSALEIGVDIGDVDLVLILGYPPSVKSFWQRFGRAGRRADRPCDCVVLDPTGIMVSSDGGIAAYMKKPAEQCLFYMENRFLRYGNVLCAASELQQIGQNNPLANELANGYGDLPIDFSNAVLNEISSTPAIPAELIAMRPPDGVSIHHRHNLREVREDEYQVLQERPELRKLEILSASNRFREAYPGAVFRHMKAAYRITTRRIGQERLELIATAHTNTAVSKTERVYQEKRLANFQTTTQLKKANIGYVAACGIQVHECVFGFNEFDGNVKTREVLYSPIFEWQNVPLRRVIETFGVVLSISSDAVDGRMLVYLKDAYCTIAGIHPRNIGIGAVTNPRCPFFPGDHKAFCLYDEVQGGFKLTEDFIDRIEPVTLRAILIANDSDKREQMVPMLKQFLGFVKSLKPVQLSTGFVGETVELARQEDSWHLVVVPGQDVVLHSDPDKREFQVERVFYSPEGIKYRISNGKTIEHKNIVIMPGETRFGWFDPNNDNLLPEGEGPNELSFDTVRFQPPTYEFTLKQFSGDYSTPLRMAPMGVIANDIIILVRDIRMPNGLGIGKWFQSQRQIDGVPFLSCRLRKIDDSSDVWSGEFDLAIGPDFEWWAVKCD